MSLKRRVLRGLRASNPWLPIASTGRVVLCYHLVEGGSGSEVDTSLADFRRQLDDLTRVSRIVPLRELVAGSGPGVALTFDDAFRNFGDVVWPELRARSLPATLFVPTGFVDGERESPLRGCDLSACSWQQLRAMVAEGLELGSHTRSHRELRSLSDEAVEEELIHAKRRIHEEAGVDARAFCYPQAKWDRRVERIVERHHELAVIGSGWHVSGRPRRVPRIPVRRDLPDVTSVLERGLWLEEWVADRARHRRRGGGW